MEENQLAEVPDFFPDMCKVNQHIQIFSFQDSYFILGSDKHKLLHSIVKLSKTFNPEDESLVCTNFDGPYSRKEVSHFIHRPLG